MNYTKQQRLAMAAEFRRARRLIESEREMFICFALVPSGGESVAAYRCSDLVRQRMNGSYTLSEWLERVAKIPRLQVLSEGDMRLYRLCWLDALIAEFSA